MLFGIYRLITNLFYPFSSLYLKYRILKKKEIFVGIHYGKAVHQQKLFDGNKNFLPITDKISKEVLSLPIYPGLRKKSLKKVIDVINNF